MASIPVRSGLVAASMQVVPDGIVLRAPVYLDEEMIIRHGAWFHPVGPGDENAIREGLHRIRAAWQQDCARQAQDSLQCDRIADLPRLDRNTVTVHAAFPSAS